MSLKDKTTGDAIKKPKKKTFLIDDNSDHKKVKGMNKNVVAAIFHNKHKDVLLNNKCRRHSINRIQSKDHRTGIYEIKKISLSHFEEKKYIHVQNNAYN